MAFITKEEYESMLDVCSGPDPLALRDKMMLMILYNTGCRVSELVSLYVDDISVETGGTSSMLSLLETVGITMPSIESDGMTIVAQKDTPGDLANMLNLGKSIDGGMTYRVEGYPTHGIVNEKWDFYNELIYHTDNGDPRRVFVWRDSFGSAMSDIIGSQFSYTYLRNAGSYDNSQVKENKPDIFVLETVERYAAWRLRQFLYE